VFEIKTRVDSTFARGVGHESKVNSNDKVNVNQSPEGEEGSITRLKRYVTYRAESNRGEFQSISRLPSLVRKVPAEVQGPRYSDTQFGNSGGKQRREG
jgi:hypothetical protein